MSDLPPMLAQLDQELLAFGDDVMQLDELDGFLTGLLVCPELVMPGEWLPVIWDGARQQPLPLADVDHANRFLALLQHHYNTIATVLLEQPQDYAPLLSEDVPSGEVLWEVWIEGFACAMAMRPDSWQRPLDADPATAAAMRGMMRLVEAAYSMEMPKHELAALHDTAPDDIARWVVTLHRWRLATHRQRGASQRPPRPAATPFSAGKVGRNDPCPCGSGKKYKKCCGLN